MEQKKVSVGLTLFNQNIYVTKSANELLFDGYEDDLIDIAREMTFTDETVTVPYDKFGWFYTVRNPFRSAFENPFFVHLSDRETNLSKFFIT